jgi:hypothetical protein
MKYYYYYFPDDLKVRVTTGVKTDFVGNKHALSG